MNCLIPIDVYFPDLCDVGCLDKASRYPRGPHFPVVLAAQSPLGFAVTAQDQHPVPGETAVGDGLVQHGRVVPKHPGELVQMRRDAPERDNLHPLPVRRINVRLKPGKAALQCLIWEDDA